MAESNYYQVSLRGCPSISRSATPALSLANWRAVDEPCPGERSIPVQTPSYPSTFGGRRTGTTDGPFLGHVVAHLSAFVPLARSSARSLSLSHVRSLARPRRTCTCTLGPSRLSPRRNTAIDVVFSWIATSVRRASSLGRGKPAVTGRAHLIRIRFLTRCM